MKSLKQHIKESFKIGKNKMVNNTYNYYPKNKKELKEIIKERLAKDKDADLNDIDVSNIEDMSYLFYKLDPHNIDISLWDVSNVEDMEGMFEGCDKFNANLSNWDVSKVVLMPAMFTKCKKFEGNGLENWNILHVENMVNMFDQCDSLKNIPSWYKE